MNQSGMERTLGNRVETRPKGRQCRGLSYGLVRQVAALPAETKLTDGDVRLWAATEHDHFSAVQRVVQDLTWRTWVTSGLALTLEFVTASRAEVWPSRPVSFCR